MHSFVKMKGRVQAVTTSDILMMYLCGFTAMQPSARGIGTTQHMPRRSRRQERHGAARRPAVILELGST